MLTGEPPFDGPKTQAIVAKVLTAEPVAPRELRKMVPANVDRAVRAALQKLPADRFAGASQFADALGGRGDAPALPGIDPGKPSTRPTVRVLAGLAVLATVLAIWGWIRDAGSGGTAGRAGTCVVASLRADRPSLVTLVDRFAVSPDGRSVVFVAQDSTGEVGLYLGRPKQLEPVPLPGGAGAWDPTFSPDGEWIAARRPDAALVKIPVTGGAPVPVVSDLGGEGTEFINLAWSADDRIRFPSRSRRVLYGWRCHLVGGGGAERSGVVLEDGLPFGCPTMCGRRT